MHFIDPEIIKVIRKQQMLREVVVYITIGSVFPLEEKELDPLLNLRTRSEWDFWQQKSERMLPSSHSKNKNNK